MSPGLGRARHRAPSRAQGGASGPRIDSYVSLVRQISVPTTRPSVFSTFDPLIRVSPRLDVPVAESTQVPLLTGEYFCPA
jgi:hypothetical protein